MKSKNDPLAKRMKSYEALAKSFVTSDGLIMMRLDGKKFSKYTSKFKRPFDEGFIEDMNELAKFLCSNIQGAILGYVQSDEISIFIWNKGKTESQIWFNGEIDKMESISASWAGGEFNRLRLLRECSSKEDNKLSLEEIQNFKFAAFDSRVFELPNEQEIVNYFIWRQKDFIRNSISTVGRTYLKTNLEYKTSLDIKEMLLENGIDWNNFPQDQKYGRFIFKETYDLLMNDVIVKRNRWVATAADEILADRNAFLNLCFPELEKI